MNRKIGVQLGGIGVVLLASAYSGYLSLFLLMCSYGAFYYLMVRYFSIIAARSKLFRHIFCLVLFVLYAQFIITLSWLLDRNFPLDATPIIIFVSILISWLTLYKTKEPVRASRLVVTKSNVTALAITVLSLIILVIPSIASAGMTSKGNALQVINGNVDDAAHVALFNDRIQFNRGVGQKSIVEENGRVVSLYPIGWHSINALLVKSAAPNITVGVPTVFAYILTKLLWFGVLIFLIADLSLTLASRYTKLSKWRELAALTPILLLVNIVIVAQLFRDGFYSFVPLLIASLCILYTLYWFRTVAERKERSSSCAAEVLTLATILGIGGSMSWILVLPGFAAFGLLLFIDEQLYRREKLLKLLGFLPLLVFAIASVIAQYFIMSVGTSVGSISFLEGLMLDGGVTQFLPLFYLFIVVATSIGLTLIIKKDRGPARHMLLYIIAIITLLVFVNLAQQSAIDRNAYYYYKMLLVLLVVATPLAILGVARMTVALRTTGLNLLFSTSLLIFVFILFFGVEPAERRAYGIAPYIAGKRVVGPEHNETIYQVLRTRANQSHYYDKHLWFAYEPGATEKNEIITMMLINKPFNDCFNAARTSFITKSDFRAPVEVIREKCGDYKISIITADGYVTRFKAIVTDTQLGDRINIKSYNDIINGV